MPELNTQASGVREGDVVKLGGAHCSVTSSAEWNERLWRLQFNDGTMLYVRHTFQLDVEREDQDAGIVDVMAEALRDAWGTTPNGENFFHILARAVLTASREYVDRDKEDPNA